MPRGESRGRRQKLRHRRPRVLARRPRRGGTPRLPRSAGAWGRAVRRPLARRRLGLRGRDGRPERAPPPGRATTPCPRTRPRWRAVSRARRPARTTRRPARSTWARPTRLATNTTRPGAARAMERRRGRWSCAALDLPRLGARLDQRFADHPTHAGSFDGAFEFRAAGHGDEGGAGATSSANPPPPRGTSMPTRWRPPPSSSARRGAAANGPRPRDASGRCRVDHLGRCRVDHLGRCRVDHLGRCRVAIASTRSASPCTGTVRGEPSVDVGAYGCGPWQGATRHA